MINMGLDNEYGGMVLSGIFLTLKMSIGGIILAMILGLLLQSCNQTSNRITVLFYRIYLTMFRGTPLLLQLFLVLYGGPYIGINWSAETIGLIGLGLYGAAYFAEIFRAGRESIPRGQLDAASDLGLTDAQVFRVVLWPQLMASCIPAFILQIVNLVKQSSVLSIITVAKLAQVAMTITVQSHATHESYTILALTYGAVAVALASAGSRAERYLNSYLHR